MKTTLERLKKSSLNPDHEIKAFAMFPDCQIIPLETKTFNEGLKEVRKLEALNDHKYRLQMVYQVVCKAGCGCGG